jgi:hypothetical protein
MTDYNNNNEIMPGFQILCLAADDMSNDYYEEDDVCNWMDDCQCQENLPTLLSLAPEECIIDQDNHIQSVDGVKLFFEELGYLTEEPESIDPTRDYEGEARILLEERNKSTRKLHINLSPIPSLDDTQSGVSSASSSCHNIEEHPFIDIRANFGFDHCTSQKVEAYSYAPHAIRVFA